MEPYLKILHTVSDTVSRTLDVEEILKTALEALTHVTGYEIASLHLLAADGVTLELRADRGLSAEMREVNRRLTMSEGIIGGVAATGITTVVRDVMGSPELLPSAQAIVRRDRIRGFVCVPIHARGRTARSDRAADRHRARQRTTVLGAAARRKAVGRRRARLGRRARDQQSADDDPGSGAADARPSGRAAAGA